VNSRITKVRAPPGSLLLRIVGWRFDASFGTEAADALVGLDEANDLPTRR